MLRFIVGAAKLWLLGVAVYAGWQHEWSQGAYFLLAFLVSESGMRVSSTEVEP